MYQSQEIYMFKEHSVLSENDLIDFAYDNFNLLRNNSCRVNVSPEYICMYTKNRDKFNWEKDNFRKTMIKERNMVLDKIINYSISFFSDTNDDNSCGIRISISCTEMFQSVLNLHLSYNFCTSPYNDIACYGEIKNIFCAITDRFDPFYACLRNDKNQNSGGRILDKDFLYPLQLHWLNYFSDRKYSDFNIDPCPELSEKRLKNGRLICFGECPIDVEDSDRLSRQKDIFDKIMVQNRIN